jgi:hypothetical protein
MPSAWHSMSASRPRPPLNEIAACTARSAKAAGKQFNALVSGKIKRLEITNTIPTWKHIRFLGHRSNDLARQAPSEMNFPFGPTSSANYHNRSQRFSVDKGLHSNRVSSNRRLCFRETEFCAQRQRRRNHSAKFTENPGRDELTPQLGRLRASYRTAGKSLLSNLQPSGYEHPNFVREVNRICYFRSYSPSPVLVRLLRSIGYSLVGPRGCLEWTNISLNVARAIYFQLLRQHFHAAQSIFLVAAHKPVFFMMGCGGGKDIPDKLFNPPAHDHRWPFLIRLLARERCLGTWVYWPLGRHITPQPIKL